MPAAAFGQKQTVPYVFFHCLAKVFARYAGYPIVGFGVLDVGRVIWNFQIDSHFRISREPIDSIV